MFFRMRVKKVQFNKSQLVPVEDVGMKGVLSGISIGACGLLQYKIGNVYKKVLFTLGASDIGVNMTIVVGMKYSCILALTFLLSKLFPITEKLVSNDDFLTMFFHIFLFLGMFEIFYDLK